MFRLTIFQLGGTHVQYSFDQLLEDYRERILWGSFQGLTWIPIDLGSREDAERANIPEGDFSKVSKTFMEIFKKEYRVHQ